MRKVTEIPATILPQFKNTTKQFKVAAYCRVSTEKEEQENSLENQIMYYKNKIESTSNWELVDIFADFGISGMDDKKRTEFQKMIEMCEKGKIDLILTKSISRFARNTVDCIMYVRMLRAKDIGVMFEKEGFNTLDATSEMLLTLFSSFAQAESESLSQNVTRGKRMRYKEGKFGFPYHLYGFKKGEDEKPEIDEEKAKIVRKIFCLYLEGYSINKIIKWLADNQIESPSGCGKWNDATISQMLKNEKYMGDALLQKTYTVDFLTKTIAKNKGEVAQYYIENNHEGIVSRETFNMVQDELKRRANLYQGEKKSRFSSKYALTGKVVCGECGAKYRRVTRSKNGKKTIVWRCVERLTNGPIKCKNSPTILEEDLYNAILDSVKKILGNPDFVKDKVRDEIEAVLCKNDEYNPQVIKRKIRNLEKELQTLRNILRETNDKEFYIYKIKSIESEILNLNGRFDKVNRYKTVKESVEIEQFIDVRKLTVDHYFDAFIKSIVKCVIINSDQGIRVVYL